MTKKKIPNCLLIRNLKKKSKLENYFFKERLTVRKSKNMDSPFAHQTNYTKLNALKNVLYPSY